MNSHATVWRIADELVNDQRVESVEVSATGKVARVGTTGFATAQALAVELRDDDAYRIGLGFSSGRWQVVLRAYA